MSTPLDRLDPSRRLRGSLSLRFRLSLILPMAAGCAEQGASFTAGLASAPEVAPPAVLASSEASGDRAAAVEVEVIERDPHPERDTRAGGRTGLRASPSPPDERLARSLKWGHAGPS